MFGPSKLEAKVEALHNKVEKMERKLGASDVQIRSINETIIPPYPMNRNSTIVDSNIGMWEKINELWKEHKKSAARMHSNSGDPQEGGRKRTRKLKKRGKKTRKH